jgi:tetratricopeptide (TPR) repeat protein
MGYPEKAMRYEGQALLIAEALPAAPPAMLFNLSRLNLERGQVNLADAQLFEASLEIPEARSRAQEMQYVLHRLAVLCAKAEVNRAAIEVDRILEELLPAGDTALLASVLAVQGDLLRLCDRYDDAEVSYLRALGLARRFLALGTEAKTLVGLAQVEAARKELEKARRHLQRALEIYTACSARVAAHGVRLLGAALPDVDVEQRFAGLERLLAFGYRFESVSADVMTTLLLGGHLSEMNEQDKARRYFRDAGREAGEVGLQHSELTANGARGVLLADAGENEEALELIEDTLRRMDELGLVSSLRELLRERYQDLTGWPWG